MFIDFWQWGSDSKAEVGEKRFLISRCIATVGKALFCAFSSFQVKHKCFCSVDEETVSLKNCAVAGKGIKICICYYTAWERNHWWELFTNGELFSETSRNLFSLWIHTHWSRGRSYFPRISHLPCAEHCADHEDPSVGIDWSIFSGASYWVKAIHHKPRRSLVMFGLNDEVLDLF